MALLVRAAQYDVCSNWSREKKSMPELQLILQHQAKHDSFGLKNAINFLVYLLDQFHLLNSSGKMLYWDQ